jgi:hypothetical protein
MPGLENPVGLALENFIAEPERTVAETRDPATGTVVSAAAADAIASRVTARGSVGTQGDGAQTTGSDEHAPGPISSSSSADGSSAGRSSPTSSASPSPSASEESPSSSPSPTSSPSP